MTLEKRIMHILEFLHPVLLLALVCPFFYVFYKERLEDRILPLYLAGYVLLICTAVSRTAIRRVKTFRVYLAVCALSLLVTFLLARTLGNLLFDRVLYIAYLLEIAVGGFWMTVDACRIRIQENRRKKAEEEQDISWVEHTVLTKKPMFIGLICFVICYFAALLNSCPVLCDIALFGGIVYLLIFLIHRQLEATENYLRDMQSIANVPKQKIRRLRMGMLLASLFLIFVLLVPSLLTRGQRTYRDLRYYDFGIKMDEEMLQEYLYQDAGSFGEVPEWMEYLETEQVWEPPKWLEYAGWVIAGVCLAGLFLVMVRGIVHYFLEFRGIPEENGDIAETLDEDLTEKIPVPRRFFGFGALSEKERIRRTYRRTIRKYRKELPMTHESPSEIEGKAVFPENFGVKELHDTYEKARYGRP